MTKIEKLPDNHLTATLEASKAYATLSSAISARMQYILNYCVEAVGGKVSWWDWQNGGDGDDKAPGDFMHSYSQHTPDSITIVGEWTHGSKMSFLTNDGNEWEIEYGEFPTRWLWEDFEQEYEDGLKALLQKKAKKLEEQKKKKEMQADEKKILLAAARAKLTKEERKALGFK